MIKRLLIGLTALIILLIGAVIILPGLVPTDTYRSKLETDLTRIFARDVKVAGEIDITTFPFLKIETGAVSLANPENFPEGQFVDVQAMSAKVKLWPLLKKRVEISSVTLQTPTIHLNRLADGRANWQGQNTEDKTTEDAGPYKRDGRFTQYDPSLALLRIENGALQFSDAMAKQSYAVDDINIDLQAPSLQKQLRLQGNFVFDGLETALDAKIESPANFLNGRETGFSVDVATPELDIDVAGQFLESQDIVFKAGFDADTQSPNTLAARLPLPEDITLPSLSSIDANGQISFDATSPNFPSLEVVVKGDGIDASFAGNINLAEGAKNAGVFSANLDDISLIEPYLEEPIEALKVVTSAVADGNVKWSGQNVTLSDIKTKVTGSNLQASFNGDAAYNSDLSLNGNFSGDTQDFAALLATAGFSQEDAAALKRLNATGQITMANGLTNLSNLVAEASEGHLNGKFTGGVTYDDALGLNGDFSGEIVDLGALDAALARDVPYSDVAKQIKISSKIRSQSEGFTLTDLSAELLEGRLNGNFIGELRTGDSSDLSGNLSLSARSLRDIANTQGVALPAATEVGPIFENFALSGNVSGSPDEILFESGTINLDNLSARGDFTLKMDRAKPLLSGALALSELDLRPYMAAWSEQNPEGGILPWSEDPITLTGLESLDAAIEISTPAIQLDRMKTGLTEGIVNLKNGALTADLQKTQLYGGNAAGTFSIRSTNGIPRVDINAKILSVVAQDFFMASGGFDKVSGSSDISLSFTGTGQSQAEIMKTLTGDGIFKIIEGQLKGIDAGALLSGVDTALAQRQIPQGIGLGQTTDFNDIDSKFTLTNGRATLNGFQLEAGSFFIEADGVIDIGQQTIDIGIRPKLTNGSDFAQFGIPLRFTGGFGKAKPSLDTGVLTEIATAKARQKAGDAIKDRVGGTLGGILGGVIGGEKSNPAAAPENTTPVPSPEVATADGGERDSDLETQDETTETETETTEEQIENALKGLFGRKKEK